RAAPWRLRFVCGPVRGRRRARAFVTGDTMTTSTLARLAIAVVAAHAVVNVLHGSAHTGIGIPLAPWQMVYVLLVIFLLPIAAGILIWKGGRGYSLLCA